MWKIIVWSTYEASPADLWSVRTDPALLVTALPRWLRVSLDDPDGLTAALTDGAEGPFAATVVVAGASFPWSMRIVDHLAPLRLTVEADSRLFRSYSHRHRLERAIGGKVRMVDELVIDPAVRPRRAVAWATRQVIAALHRSLADQVPFPAIAVGQHRAYALEPGNAGHAGTLFE